jgi:uracil-DNA glycosylase
VIDRRDERALARLHREIRACTRCADAGYIERAFPIVAGRASDRIMIVGQAPGAVELTTGLPFSGRAGAELRRWLARAGIDEAHLPYRTSMTKCFPGKARTGSGDRKPSPPEIANCAPWLVRELALVRPDILLLVGQLAIERFWGRVPLHEAVGRRRRDGGRVLIPLPHPSGASRWLNDAANRALLDRALDLLRGEARALTMQPVQVKSLRARDAHRSSLRRSRSGNGPAAI